MERKLKVGLVGASASGGWSPVAHIPALKALENVELAAVCTSRPELAKAAAEAFEVKRAYHDIKDLVSQDDIDIISVVVKIPNHYQIVKEALEAGKHVYCEWPLGATLKETEELAALAREKNLITAIGLQGHYAPELVYLKHLIEKGWFGQVVSVKMEMQTKGSAVKKSRKAWEEEKHRQATLFFICGGHTIYYISDLLGAITEISSQLSTRFKEFTLEDSGERVANEIEDQILINGFLGEAIPFDVNISSVPFHSRGWTMEIYGTKGTIIATSDMLPQITPIKLMGSQGDSALKEIIVPENFIAFPTLPPGPASNVGRNYGMMANAIIKGESFHPNFDDALAVHSLLASIRKSSLEKSSILI